MAYRNSPSFFRRVPSPTLTASRSPRLGFATPTENCNRYYLNISGTGKAVRTSNFVRTFLVSIGTKAHYKFLKKQPWAESGLSKFFRAPMYWAHRAVIFAIVQVSCILFLVVIVEISCISSQGAVWVPIESRQRRVPRG